MAKINIPAGDHTFIADQADTTYVLKAGRTIDTADTLGIDGFNAAVGRTFLINGTVTGATQGISAGSWNAQPDDIHILIGKTGHIESGTNAVILGGVNSSVVNRGSIETTEAQGSGIGSEGHDNLLDNQGTITSRLGISSIGDNNEITNSGKITAVYQGVLLNSIDGQENRLVNTGVINAGDANNLAYAVYGGGGDEYVVNSGRMMGDIALNNGDDTFVSKGGKLTGEIRGGGGDDTYVIDKAFTLVEDSGQGFDRVRASVSYTVAANIEEATLTGKANIDLTGTSTGDLLYGNRGRNEILGGDGTDYITGKGGNDRLTGGSGIGNTDIGDVFVFTAHSGRDTITDFQDGMDTIHLGNYAGIETFDDLSGRIRQVGDDVVIKLLGGDSIRLLDTDRNTIGSEDFDF